MVCRVGGGLGESEAMDEREETVEEGIWRGDRDESNNEVRELESRRSKSSGVFRELSGTAG
jgi:hypothetical protein